MKKLTTFITVILFLPCAVIGYLFECASIGFVAGRELGKEFFT